MSKKCVNAGIRFRRTLLSVHTARQFKVEKEEIRRRGGGKRRFFVIGAVLVFLAGVGFAFSLYHKPRSMRPTPGSFIRIRIIPTGFW